MSDEELSNALAIRPWHLWWQWRARSSIDFLHRIGLRIWGGWHIVNHVTEKPLFQGKASIAMARLVYKISDPSNQQMELFQ